MAANSKYVIQISPADALWKAAIVRRASRKKVVESKAKTGFASEAEAQTWAEAELKAFVENQSERNQRRDKKRVP